MAEAPRGWIIAAPASNAGKTLITTPDGKTHDWANEVVDKVVSLQQADGTWSNKKNGRWMESDQHLATAYAMLSLRAATQKITIRQQD